MKKYLLIRSISTVRGGNVDTDRIALHTSLIEQEDDLLKQVDTCQFMLAAAWRCAQSSVDEVHFPTVRRLISALRNTLQSVEDDLFDVRVKLLPFANPKRSAP